MHAAATDMATAIWDEVAGATIMAGAGAAIAVGTNQQAPNICSDIFLEAANLAASCVWGFENPRPGRLFVSQLVTMISFRVTESYRTTISILIAPTLFGKPCPSIG